MTNPYKMDTELKNTSEDTELTDCDGEKVVTMMDVLQEQEDFEEDVNAVLGASDEKDCTYSKGYIKRQAIYACMTCCSDAMSDPTKRAGVCLACSLTCHENHDLIELYTKRNFRCDCGNPKFNSHPCQFTPDKTDLNEENNYNQNFSGVYCVCQRPYPDPESTTEVEMIQCIICEDWLHASHLEATVPDNDQYSEMICKGCMGKNEFLHDYGNLAVNIDVDVITNGVDDDKMCNGDDILKVKAQDENVKAEQISEKVNGDDSNKNEENLSESKEFSEEKKDVKSVDIPMEMGESKQLDPNSTTLTEESSERVNNENNEALDTKDKEETIQDIDDKNTKDATIEKAIDSETVHQEQQNENKESATDAKQTESTVEVENPESVNKNAEQLEEERLLADPDDYNKKSNAEKKDDIKEENNVQNMPQAEDNKNSETPIPEATNENMANNDLNSDDKKDESQTNEDSTVSEKQVEEQTTENPPIETKSSAVDISATAEVEMKDDLKENYIGESKSDIQNGDSEVKISEKRKLSTEEDSGSDIKKQKLECVRPKGVQRVHKGATFWPSTFRQKLCTCWECITMYKDLSVLFLIDPEDTVTAYENLGKQKINGKPISQYEKGLQALSSLDRIQQINALTEYNKMRDKLLDFLKSFKDRREVVKEEDIKAFFAGMKPKREPDGVYFCR